MELLKLSLGDPQDIRTEQKEGVKHLQVIKHIPMSEEF